MKKEVEIKQDEKSFERFTELFSKVIGVPKSELEKRDKTDKERKKQRKAMV
jgi:hypothetical protein